MIKFNDRFEFEQDAYQWILHEWYDGEDKDGNPKRQKRTTYHYNLVQMCNRIIDRSTGGCESIHELKKMFKECSLRTRDEMIENGVCNERNTEC